MRKPAFEPRIPARNGHNWSDRFPLITEAAVRNRITSFVIDGAAVLPGVDGRSDFNGLHSSKYFRSSGINRRSTYQA
jgi:bifunctional non-homologous end joining protein LigD